MELVYFGDHAPPGYTHRRGIATSSVYKYTNTMVLYIALSIAFNIVTGTFCLKQLVFVQKIILLKDPQI